MRKRVKKSLQMCLVVLGLFLTPWGVCRAENYEQWLSKCTSYKDVAKWQERYLLYDVNRSKDARHRGQTKQEKLKTNSPEVTFKLKRGVCMPAFQILESHLFPHNNTFLPKKEGNPLYMTLLTIMVMDI